MRKVVFGAQQRVFLAIPLTLAISLCALGRDPVAAVPPSNPCSCSLCRRNLIGTGLGVGLAAGAAVPVIRGDFRDKFFVAQMQGMADYERKMAPRKAALFQAALHDIIPRPRKSPGQSDLRVVEVGVGAGTNFDKLTATGVRMLTAVEPNEDFVPVARDAAKKAGMELKVMKGVMEHLPFQDSSVDVVVATLVLCSVASVTASLKEVRRVLRPGGRYIFTEHVAAPGGTWLRAAQDVFNPLQQWFSCGCRLNREPLRDIEDEFGSAMVHAERFVVNGPDQERSLPQLGQPLPPHFLLSPHFSGYAEKRA